MGQPFSPTRALVAWATTHGHSASTRVPGDPMPAEFVTFEAVGGSVESRVVRARVAVRCWADTDLRAEEIALGMRNLAVLEAPPAGIHSIRVSDGPYPFDDPYVRKRCWQLVYDVACQLNT